MTVRVTGIEQEVIVHELSELRVSQEFATIVDRNVTNPQLSATQVFTQVVDTRGTDSALYASQVFATFLIARTVDFRWIDMYIEETFPHDISYNSIGAIRFETEITRVDSGFDQRNQRWAQPLMEYDVAYGVRTMEDLHDLKQFFYAMRGRLYAFRYFDRFDFSSQFVTAVEGRTIPATTPFDQQLGVGDGVTYIYQLRKEYKTKYSLASLFRPIYKPKNDTVKAGIAGTEVTAFEVDYAEGLVTMNSRVVATNNMTLSHVSGSIWKIQSSGGAFTDPLFAVGRKVVMTGWNNALNNTTINDVVTISSLVSVNSIEVTLPAGFGAAEAGADGVSIAIHPAPKLGDIVSAGFEFYVPVRFDVDRLPISLEEYGIGGASDVKLVEVRKGAE